MNDDERPQRGFAAPIDDAELKVKLAGPHPGWDTEAEAEELCERMLQEQPGLEEQQLWRELAASRLKGRSGGQSPIGAECGWPEHQKLRERVRVLIGRLPIGSLEDFWGLVAFTETFSSRVRFVCDLVVYLFAEREKGPEPDCPDAERYLDFFVQKLMWELEVVDRIAHEQPLSALEGEYCQWLWDRILDGEVLV
jgi:hypothetical protein